MNKTHLDNQIEIAKYNYNYFFTKMIVKILQTCFKLSCILLISEIFNYTIINIIAIIYTIISLFNIYIIISNYKYIIEDIRKTLKNDYDIVVANGQNQLKDKIFRMGTLGFVSERDAITAVGSLEAALHKLGHKFELGKGLAALIEYLNK